jgi:hypothetical protein
MTLDDFFKECRKKGTTPLSYRRQAETLNGSTTVEYENPEYTRAKERLVRILNPNAKNNKMDDLVSRFYGEEVVIHTKSGYHYGTLLGYDGKGFLLGDYLFDKKLVDTFDFTRRHSFGSDSFVPVEDFIYISHIPLKVEEAHKERMQESYS